MKKILLFGVCILLLFSGKTALAGTLTTIYGGGPNEGTDCSSGHVPQDSDTYRAGTIYTCVPHNYYGSTYTRSTSVNSHTMCTREDMAVGVSGTQLQCQRWDDAAPTVSDDYALDGTWTNAGTNVVLSAIEPNSDGGITTGSIRSGFNEIRYCEGTASCNPTTVYSSPLPVGADRDNFIRYIAYDNAGNASATGSIEVEIEDNPPVVSNLDYYDGWTNSSSLNVTFDLSDNAEPIESGLSKFTLQVRTSSNNPDFTSWSIWEDVSDLSFVDAPISGAFQSITYNYTPTNNTAYEFQVKVRDVAGNDSGWVQSVSPLKITMIDQTPPTVLADIISSPGQNLLATLGYIYDITVNNQGGSPVEFISGNKENESINNSQLNFNNLTSHSSNANDTTFRISWHISEVDNYRDSDLHPTISGLNSAREYTFNVVQLCDVAGNCSVDGPETFDHNVYANTTNITTHQVSSEGLSNTSNVADGNVKDLHIELRDVYTNAIVPASGIGRTIDFHWNFTNTMYQDQYSKSGLKSVFINESVSIPTDDEIDTVLETMNQESTDGIYRAGFKFYSPTANSYSTVDGVADPDAEFSIDDIWFDINAASSIVTGDDPQNQAITGSSIQAFAQPLYTSNFSTSGNGIATYGFIEGIEQQTDISHSRNTLSSVNGSNSRSYFEFGGVNPSTNQNEAHPVYIFDIVGSSGNANGPQGVYSSLEELAFNGMITSLMEQPNPQVDTFQNAYLANIVKYELDSKTIVYPSAIIGKDSYHEATGITNNTTQVGLKVEGKTYSTNNKSNILTGQEVEIKNINGDITKSILRRNIKKNVYDMIKNLNVANGDFKELLNNTIIYYKENGGEIKYSDIEPSYKEQGGKTIVINGADLIIESGDIDNVTGNGVHGIIVLKEGVNGGNILIDDDVLNIEAVMYADKSIFPYESTLGVNYGILEQSDGINMFRNQLYIYGAIFSNNTIGGSRSTPLICPYYVAPPLCSTKEEAQIYDLNFLRRFYRYEDHDGDDSDDDGVDDITGLPSTLKIPANFGSAAVGVPRENADYPVVIRYNPLIQTTPAPLFEEK